MKASIKRLLRALPLLLLAPLLLTLSALALLLADLAWALAGRRRRRSDTAPDARAASLVIPNWNGRDLLERFLPSWAEAIRAHPGSEIIVVDNGSDDGSAAWIRDRYPGVQVLALPENLGFGGGSNRGFLAAKNDIVVLLNSDMRVSPDFLAPLLAGFRDDKGDADPAVFAVSCQIFLSDPARRREETGLTQGCWQDGALRVGHRDDPKVDRLFPCLYGGGGSCAFDRRKFLELGGFDELLAPFYLEDTDLGFMAWKRGWKVLYQPASVVWHEHRGTIGKKFDNETIERVLQKNFLLFTWKDIHGWKRLAEHFPFVMAQAVITGWSGTAPGRASAGGILRAFRQLPGTVKSRWRARELAVFDDTETFARSRPAYFHDSFSSLEKAPRRPRVLFISPYPICPPTHGGGLFMFYTLRELSRWCEVHAIVMLDFAAEREANEELLRYCRTVEFYVRRDDRDPHLGSIEPHAMREFQSPEVEWLVERQTLLHRIDVIQLEYTPLGQYGWPFRRLVTALFEHDVYFQSVGRAIPFMTSTLDRVRARFEYLRAIRFELRMLPKCDHIQVCTRENKEFLEGFLPRLAPRIDAGLRAGIETSRYPFPGGPRRPLTMLFLGSFRHTPNQVALDWFSRHVLPLVVARLPSARLVAAGSDPPPRHAFYDPSGAIDLLGFVDDIQPLFSECAVFICPIRSGSGVRVKLLEAFASGIPVVSTRLGAEGLARNDEEFCALADDPATFAERVVELLTDPERGARMAARARLEVATNWDMAAITGRLADKYRQLLAAKRAAAGDGRGEMATGDDKHYEEVTMNTRLKAPQ
jgi:GT2 family glycosyltransferase/glycosyltransferase involved in cell wall biosynthesis